MYIYLYNYVTSGDMKMERKKDEKRVYRKTFVLTVNPKLLKLINEGKYAEVRDYWHKQLEELEEDRQLCLKTGNKGLYEEVWEKWCHALRMYDRYYVLADMKAKGIDTKKRGW